uniref:dioxygenase family protein n=1 Tax=Herbidospora sakaeratensis TaxID=564415 RepID=UPI0007850666|nr:protocatechuate dioxygenase [Herbidospora sakaeratensis]
MTDHDEGRRVSRRTMIAGVGSIGLGALLAACGSGGSTPVTTSTGATATITPQAVPGDLAALLDSSGACALTPSTTPGPYYFDADKIRSDIREDRPGTLLDLAIRVRDSETCEPLKDAVVEIWHCDAGGLYSGAESASTGGPGGGMGDLVPTDDERYLRGAQVTGADGIVVFTTIWPGWYRGRTVHVHAMVHVGNDRTLTTQVMFDEARNDAVLAAGPYAGRGGRDTRNDDDSIFRSSMVMATVPDGDGFRGAITFDVDPGHDGR